jgi:hypothetical protein
VDVVFVTEASRADVTWARNAGRFWRYTPEPRLKVLGRPVGPRQAACLVLCGLATVLLDLRAHRVPVRLPLPRTAYHLTLSGPTRTTSAVVPAALPPRLA